MDCGKGVVNKRVARVSKEAVIKAHDRIAFAGQRSDTHKVTISFARTRQDAMLQNLLINNETLPSSITRKLQMQLQ